MNTHTKTAENGKITKTETRIVSVENCESEGTVKVTFSSSFFIDFLDALGPLEGALQANLGRKQEVMNYAFKHLLVNSTNYRDENLNTMIYFNELCSALSRSTHLMWFLHDILRDYDAKPEHINEA